MKGYRHGVAAVGVSSENSVVVTGGHGGMSIETICEAWNPDSKRWSKIASLPTRRFAHACVGMQLNELSIVRAVEAAKKATGAALSTALTWRFSAWPLLLGLF